MKLSTPQLARFWRVFSAAWRAYSAGTGESGEEAKHVWRREQLAECGFASLGEVDRTNGYDVVMLHFATLAGDDRTAAYFAVAVERRYRHLIQQKLTDLSNVAGHLFDWSYARGLMDHMHLPADIDDVPAARLLAVYQALDTHLRRLKGRPAEHRKAA